MDSNDSDRRPVSSAGLSVTNGNSGFFASLINIGSSTSKDEIPISSPSNFTLEPNTFSPKPTPDFPLLGFPKVRTPSPSMTGISLKVPSNSPRNSQHNLEPIQSPVVTPDIIERIDERMDDSMEQSDLPVEWL